MKNDELKIAADLLESNGFDEVANVIRSPFSESLGKRISVYGPNYIWRGLLVGITPQMITLDDCHQVFETGDHRTVECDSELIGKQHFTIGAICNWGECQWS